MRTQSLPSFPLRLWHKAHQWWRWPGANWLILLALLASTQAIAKVEHHDWIQLSQDGVQLVTDVKPATAAELMRNLRLFRSVVERYVPSEEGFKEDLEIILFARRRDFARLYKPRHFGAFTLPQLTRTSLVVAPSRDRDSLRKHLFHEYVHYRVRASIAQSAPVWFEEGLATLLADVKLVTRAQQKAADLPDMSILGAWPGYPELRSFPLQQLLAARGVEGFSVNQASAFYTTSHHLVREILLAQNFDQAAIDGFVYQQNPTIDVLFDRPVGEVERLLRRSMVRAAPALVTKPLTPLTGEEPGDESGNVTALPPAEVLDVLGRTLQSVNPKKAQQLYSRLAVLRPDAAYPLLGVARALSNQDDQPAAMQAFRRAEQLEPDAAEVVIARSLLGTRGCTIRRTDDCMIAWRAAVKDLRRGLFEEPDRFDAIYRLGQAHLFLGQPGEAVNYLAIAAQRAPWSARVNYFLGEAYRLLGDSRARVHLERAARWADAAYIQASAEAALAELTATNKPPTVGDAR